MKITIVTLYTPEIASFSEESVKNLTHYCRLHNYTFHSYSTSLSGEVRGNWCKPKVILNHFDDSDYVVWLDSDVVILDMQKKMEDLILPHQDKEFISTTDSGGWLLNNGFLIFKTTPYMKDFLGVLWRQHLALKSKERGDQKFFIDYLKKVQLSPEKYHLYPQADVCAPPFLRHPHSFSLHVMGMHLNDIRLTQIRAVNGVVLKEKPLPIGKREEFFALREKWAEF